MGVLAMKTAFQKIAHFNELIGNCASMSDGQQLQVQFDMIKEEFEELGIALETYLSAVARCDEHGTIVADVYEAQVAAFVAIRDGIADVLVTTFGLAHRLGVDADADLEAVQVSNMSKFVDSEPAAEAACREISERLGIDPNYRETGPGVWAITSDRDQVGNDGKTYPKGKLLKPSTYCEPEFT